MLSCPYLPRYFSSLSYIILVGGRRPGIIQELQLRKFWKMAVRNCRYDYKLAPTPFHLSALGGGFRSKRVLQYFLETRIIYTKFRDLHFSQHFWLICCLESKSATSMNCKTNVSFCYWFCFMIVSRTFCSITFTVKRYYPSKNFWSDEILLLWSIFLSLIISAIGVIVHSF